MLDQVRAGSYKLSVTCPEGLDVYPLQFHRSESGAPFITTEGRRTASKSINLEAR